MSITASQKIGSFVETFEGKPVADEVVHQAARIFLDTFSVAVGGLNEPVSRIIRDYSLSGGSSGPSTVWCTGRTVRPEDAALANAVMAHALDYDDVTYSLRGHPSVVLMPALLAVAEAENATGEQISASYACGFEVVIKLALAMAQNHYARGWHSTSCIGVIGAAAACSHLMGLRADQVAAAVGLSCSQASGIRRSFGTMAKCIQPGNAAASAVRSARLAVAGFTAPLDSLEGDYGFAALFGNGEDLQPYLDSLGAEPLELFHTGVDVKKYPCCYATHRALQGILDLRSEGLSDPEEIERIRVRAHPRGLVALIHHRPRTGTEGKFSMEYVLAAALLDGAVGLNSFTDKAIQRPEAQALLRKVECSEEGESLLPPRATVEVDLRSGERRSIRVETLRGSSRLPLRDTELEENFATAPRMPVWLWISTASYPWYGTGGRAGCAPFLIG